MGYKKGLEKYKIFGQLKLTLFGPQREVKKKKEKKVSRDNSWHVPENNNFIFIWEEKTISSRIL